MDELNINNKIIEYFSKPSADVELENSQIVKSELDDFNAQIVFSALLETFPPRKKCVCCGDKLQGVNFEHRKISFIECLICGHIQTHNKPPKDYLKNFSNSTSAFSEIYPKLSKNEFLSRRNRIYKPKLDWIFSALNKLGMSESELLSKKWGEIGSGAGYFLSAAKAQGINNIIGFEQDKQLYLDSLEHNSDIKIHNWEGTFENVIETQSCDIFCSFFVLEHIDNLPLVWKNIKEKPKNTLFVFSVPVFGLSSILENTFSDQFARNLDGVFHTQLFTDDSIRYAMNLAGCRLLSEWIFGQDVSDLSRFLGYKLYGNQVETKIHLKLNAQLLSINDDIQILLDQKRLSDQRHFIAIRE
jgi:hypothetical protein